ncbi:hypothetical protein MNEG_14137 [Monoraphidium neglectum]|uniref:Uncharacterized protein n=1 Tax=Monoraphidium neglectum TaxID=145388 RepID=A0A0D2MFE3_9CHLO|nr:hypothetical protein MNEG_14137 [Monoraphidium neglectum]KIY93825.1 hypothetical protein MNEG_14137 [Monoraphidium neglectum]|eukprot:XP_013892845.1 hypothetical protein MNEG_14137 [Monoraphidium neglectum]
MAAFQHLAIVVLACYLAVASAVPGVKITIRWDNKADEVIKQAVPETRKNLANILCGKISEKSIILPKKGTPSLVDKSNLVDSSSTAIYYCLAADGKQSTAAKIYAACANKKNQEEFKDEMEDDTDFPELEVEAITCDPNFVQIP